MKHYTRSMRILLVEDDALLGDGVKAGLTQAGCGVDWVKDGIEAELALKGGSYAAVVLDLGLPRLSGMDFLRRVRGAGDKTPVLILTARDAIEDRIKGLDGGADDYVVKPFDLHELTARLRALTRRSGGEAAPVLRVENWLGAFLTGDFSFLEMLWFSCVNVYFVGPTERALLPFLWTMRIEMLGSLLVLVYLFADFQIRRRYTAIVFMLLFCLAADSMLACFPIGMLCSAARANGVFERLRRRPFVEPAAMAGFAAALVTGTWCNQTWEGFLAPSVVAGAMAVVCVYASANLTRFFSTSLSRWLGSISFPIFLLQFPVIVSFTSFLALWASARGLLTPGGIWAIVAVSGALCLLVSRIFRPVEAWAARAGNLTCDLMMRPHP